MIANAEFITVVRFKVSRVEGRGEEEEGGGGEEKAQGLWRENEYS